VIAAAGLALQLVAFAAMQAVQLHRITRERDRANRTTDFMTRMFKVSQPSEATVREILYKASTDIDTGLQKDPELQANMMDVMGNVYTSLGLYQRGDSLITQIGLANSLGGLGKYNEAEKLLLQTRDIQRRVLGLDSPRTADTTYNLACLASWTVR
jgi:eukaryotic-like serine/threonine-protein kinase